MMFVMQAVKRPIKSGKKRMGHSQAEKSQNHERILEAAARQIRQCGLDSVSVGKLMQAVNLTHGGFYGHFSSRSDLIAQALKRALADGERGHRAAAAKSEHLRTFGGFVRSYMSRSHRDSRDSGCAIAALVSDVGRADDSARAVMEEHIEGYISGAARGLGGVEEERAMVAVSAMVGALALSRVMTDKRRSDGLLRAVRDFVTGMQRPAAGKA